MKMSKNTCFIFNNNRKKTDKHPDMIGDATIECPHCKQEAEYQLSFYKKYTKNGDTYLRGTFRLPDVGSDYYKRKQEDSQKYEENKGKEPDDIPF